MFFIFQPSTIYLRFWLYLTIIFLGKEHFLSSDHEKLNWEEKTPNCGQSILLRKLYVQESKASFDASQSLSQGNLLRGIDKRTIRREAISFCLCSLLSNTLFIWKQDGSELQSFLYNFFPKNIFWIETIHGQHCL